MTSRRSTCARSYTLASLGAHWPAHLEATRPGRDREPNARESWPDFLIDLARLEHTFCEVYNAPGVEGVRLPSAADVPIELDPGADWHAVTATPVVCLRLLFARFPVGAYLIAVRRGDAPQLPAAQQTYLAFSRRDYVVTITELDGGGHALLSELADGASDRGLIAAIEYPPARRVV
jgi:hypothetical protein